jgi:hypothetical protein
LTAAELWLSVSKVQLLLLLLLAGCCGHRHCRLSELLVGCRQLCSSAYEWSNDVDFGMLHCRCGKRSANDADKANKMTNSGFNAGIMF